MNTTIVYYTSNNEYELFEQKIRDTIIKNSNGLPIISVSQKPIDFGTNICVGDIGASALNICKQLYIGLEAVKTDFVITTESDTLYPKEYFSFIPERDDIFYYPNNLYIGWHGRTYLYKKKMRDFAIVPRLYLMRILKELIEIGDKNVLICTEIRSRVKEYRFNNNIPLLTIKTDRQLHKRHPYARNSGTTKIPFWGKSNEIWRQYPLC